MWRDAADLVTTKGYPCEEHTVPTEDGYILKVHRIPHGQSGAPSELNLGDSDFELMTRDQLYRISSPLLTRLPKNSQNVVGNFWSFSIAFDRST